MSDDIRKFVDMIKNPTPEEAERLKKRSEVLANKLGDIFTPSIKFAMQTKMTEFAKTAARISEALESVNQTRDKVLSLIDRGESIDQFFDLPPINGIELLAILAEMDERTQGQARQILTQQKSDAARKGHTKTQQIKAQFQQDFLAIRANEKENGEALEKKAVIARLFIEHYRIKNPGTKDPATERTVIAWLSEAE